MKREIEVREREREREWKEGWREKICGERERNISFIRISWENLLSFTCVRKNEERDKRREGKREKADGQMKEVEIRWEREREHRGYE